MMTGLFGGEGFIMQKLEGNGWVFVQSSEDPGPQQAEHLWRSRLGALRAWLG